MNEKIKLGEINTLEISRVSEPGLYLKSLDDSEVLLPNIYIKQEMKLGQHLEVFIYTDSEDRLVATTLMPKAKLNEIALLEVVDMAKFGAFVDLGLAKDLLVPKNKQRTPFQIGEKRLIKVIEDEKTHRLIGVEKFQDKFNKNLSNFQKNDEVEIIVCKKTPLGFKVYVNNKFEGMIFHTEIFTKINIGDKKIAYIKTIREDGKLDISLQKIAQDSSFDDTLKIIEVLKSNNNKLKITSKSDPKKIIELFQMSKKRFKAALNILINNNQILLEDDGILIKD